MQQWISCSGSSKEKQPLAYDISQRAEDHIGGTSRNLGEGKICLGPGKEDLKGTCFPCQKRTCCCGLPAEGKGNWRSCGKTLNTWNECKTQQDVLETHQNSILDLKQSQCYAFINTCRGITRVSITQCESLLHCPHYGPPPGLDHTE